MIFNGVGEWRKKGGGKEYKSSTCSDDELIMTLIHHKRPNTLNLLLYDHFY